MTIHTVTIQIPHQVYRRIEQKSEANQRSVKEEIVETVTNTFQAEDESLPEEFAIALAELDLMSDAELWQAARLQPFPELNEELQALFDKRQREGLTPPEQERTEQIVHFFEQSTLVRAKSAALLKERGHQLDSLFSS
jgi:hypothetical protein